MRPSRRAVHLPETPVGRDGDACCRVGLCPESVRLPSGYAMVWLHDPRGSVTLVGKAKTTDGHHVVPVALVLHF